jgi:hypothetical protein
MGFGFFGRESGSRRVMIVRGGEMVYASDGIFLISRIQHIHPQEIRSEQTLPLKIVA